MYPSAKVTEFIREHFIPVRIHIKEQPAMWKRFSIRWTPTVMVLGPDGEERRRVEGFLPADELLAQLELGLADIAVAKKDWKEAERWFQKVADEYPKTEAGPEALYWAGVSRYSGTHDAKYLQETAKNVGSRYGDTAWAKRASVWAG